MVPERIEELGSTQHLNLPRDVKFTTKERGDSLRAHPGAQHAAGRQQRVGPVSQRAVQKRSDVEGAENVQVRENFHRNSGRQKAWTTNVHVHPC